MLQSLFYCCLAGGDEAGTTAGEGPTPGPRADADGRGGNWLSVPTKRAMEIAAAALTAPADRRTNHAGKGRAAVHSNSMERRRDACCPKQQTSAHMSHEPACTGGTTEQRHNGNHQLRPGVRPSRCSSGGSVGGAARASKRCEIWPARVRARRCRLTAHIITGGTRGICCGRGPTLSTCSPPACAGRVLDRACGLLLFCAAASDRNEQQHPLMVVVVVMVVGGAELQARAAQGPSHSW